MFYASRLISDQGPKGNKKWRHELKEVYTIALLENFTLSDINDNIYLQNVSLCYTETGKPFYDKLHFIFIELVKFNKTEKELKSELDEWIYSLKYASKMNVEPPFTAKGLVNFFTLAKHANLTPEDRDMYRTAQQIAWDNQNILDYAREEGLEEGLRKVIIEKKQIAKNLKDRGIDLQTIIDTTGLSFDEVSVL